MENPRCLSSSESDDKIVFVSVCPVQKEAQDVFRSSQFFSTSTLCDKLGQTHPGLHPGDETDVHFLI